MYGNHITCDYYRHPLLLSASRAAVPAIFNAPTYIWNIAPGTALNWPHCLGAVNESLLNTLPMNKTVAGQNVWRGGRPKGRVPWRKRGQPKPSVCDGPLLPLSAVVKIQHEIIHKYFILIHGHYVQVHLSAASVCSSGRF